MLTKIEKDNLEIFILAILNKEPSYGYKIITDLESVIKISESTLYPILRRLEERNNLSTFSVETNGRTRKYFKITDQGKERVFKFKEDLDNLSSMFSYISRL